MSCWMSGDSITGGDIKQLTRDNTVNDSTTSESMSSDTKNNTDITDRYEYQKTM